MFTTKYMDRGQRKSLLGSDYENKGRIKLLVLNHVEQKVN